MPVPSYYQNYICMEFIGELIWVPNPDAYECFHKKDLLVKEIQILRNLTELTTDKDSVKYLKDKMNEANKKLISCNRKIQREYWKPISNTYMQKMLSS